mmetsp:Transcript_6892/g.11478  ORF Transcript_6892/g.11478 Transcript_6892/m.11478 type:complete len:376 (+) Transcript_6892:145-1272(+)
MSSNFEAQLNSYTETRKNRFYSEHQHTTRTNEQEASSHSLQPCTRTSNNVCTCGSCLCSNTSASCCKGCTFRSNSLELFHIPLNGQRIPLRIHYLWPVFLVLSSLASFSASSIHGLFTIVMGGPILFFSVLLHEIGHATAALYLGGDVESILLWPLGGLASISFYQETDPKTDALIAIAGPLTHFPQVAFWIIVMYCTNNGSISLSCTLTWGFNFWLCLCAGAILIQVLLFCFNLIPAYPLDGGRIFRSSLQLLGMRSSIAFMLTAIIGSLFGWYFVYSGLGSKLNQASTLYSGMNEVAMGIFILYNCLLLWRVGIASYMTEEREESFNSTEHASYNGVPVGNTQQAAGSNTVSGTGNNTGTRNGNPIVYHRLDV